MDEFGKLQSLNLAKVDEARKQTDKVGRELADLRTQEVFVKSIQSLAKFIEGHTTKTVVMNQIKDFATSEDMESLGKFLLDIVKELKTHENTDITPLVTVLNEAVSELKSIPKEQLDITFPEQKDYSEAFKQLLGATKEVMGAIKAQKTTVEAPVVTYEAPDIHVDAPDIKPLGKDLEKSFLKAVKSIVFPKFDVSEVVKEQKNTTKAIQDVNKTLQELPTGGSSGSSSIAPFLVGGALPITGTITAEASTLAEFQFNDSDATTTALTEYFGYTKPDGTWLVKKLTDTTLRYATITNNGAVLTYGDAWAGIASLTYGRMDEAF